MDGNSTAPLRSRSSQSPSPSHSASASATSSIHKRKLTAPEDHAPPFPSSFDGALTSNDDLESISARGGNDSEEFEDVVDDDEYDDSSIRNFTASRLDAPTGRNTKLKTENSVKIEPGEGAAPAVSVSTPASGAVVKEDTVKSIFTENLQTSGAYCAREESLKREEETGKLKFACVSNDKIDEHMIWLIGLKNIFARQLPNMPKEYIVRLVMDRGHKSVMVIRHNTVVGGITYRPYISQKFGEIAFCAITSDEQVKGYGTRLMNHLKQHARDVDGLTHFLTYADNNAVGYFNKQGFTKNINLERERWHGYIKDYDGGILMECKIDPKLPYTDLSTMIHRQRQAIDEKIRELSNCHIVNRGIDFLKKEAGFPKRVCKLEDIPGLSSAGWTPDQWGHSRFKYFNASPDGTLNQKLTGFMRSILKALHDHADAWPFKEPVDVRDVPDYYDIIRDPMAAMEARTNLGSLLKTLPPVDFCCVYGSSLHPNNNDKSSMEDYILGVADPQQWHSENLKMNRDHYASWMASVGGAKLITKAADHIGVGVHFNPFVSWNDKMYKYGVVRMDDLVEDMLSWKRFYLSGRLQKPVRVIVDNKEITNTNLINLRAASSAALLLLPSKFTERELYAKICSLSYTGDLRMLFAEDKNKVKKIVEGQFELFRNMYKPLVEEYTSNQLLRLSSCGDHQMNISQDCSLSATSSIVSYLPESVRNQMGVGSTETKAGQISKLTIGSREEAASLMQKVLRRRVMISSARQAVAGFIAVGAVHGVKYLGKKMMKAWKS